MGNFECLYKLPVPLRHCMVVVKPLVRGSRWYLSLGRPLLSATCILIWCFVSVKRVPSQYSRNCVCVWVGGEEEMSCVNAHQHNSSGELLFPFVLPAPPLHISIRLNAETKLPSCLSRSEEGSCTEFLSCLSEHVKTMSSAAA